jgi:hypothetical protein
MRFSGCSIFRHTGEKKRKKFHINVQMPSTKQIFAAAALAATICSASVGPDFQRRVLTTLKIDVVDDATGDVTTSVLNLRDGDAPAEAAKSFCANAVKDPAPDCADLVSQQPASV